jgi:hypothetical protein
MDRISPASPFCAQTHVQEKETLLANGERYPRAGGMRQRRFDGTNSKPRKLLENAQTPTRRVHAVLGGFLSSRRFLF